MYHMVQMGWDGHVGHCGPVVVPMVHPMGSQCTTWYRWDGTDMWDSVGQWWCPWYIPWDPIVPHGTDGMGRTCGTVWVSGGAHGTSHGIPLYHMVQMGWDGHVGQCGSVVPVYHMVQLRWNGHVGQCGSVVVHVVHPMGSHCTTWYRWDRGGHIGHWDKH